MLAMWLGTISQYGMSLFSASAGNSRLYPSSSQNSSSHSDIYSHRVKEYSTVYNHAELYLFTYFETALFIYIYLDLTVQ